MLAFNKTAKISLKYICEQGRFGFFAVKIRISGENTGTSRLQFPIPIKKKFSQPQSLTLNPKSPVFNP